MRPRITCLYAVLAMVLVQCIACRKPDRPKSKFIAFQHFFGQGWLAWSPAERTEYVDTYLDGYATAYSEACRSAGDIFIERMPSGRAIPLAKLPYQEGDENSIDVPLTHCLNSQRKYSLRHRDENGLFTSPYPEIITEMYEKHPDAQSAPYFLLITLLSDGNARTAEELYKAQLGKWPNARFDPTEFPTR
jgi:hypothetical protein